MPGTAIRTAWTGRLRWPRDAAGEATIYIEDGPCFEPSSRTLSRTLAAPSGVFEHEFFVPQGTKVWVCAGLVTPDGNISHSAAAPDMPFEARGQGEVIIPQLELTLAAISPALDVPQPR